MRALLIGPQEKKQIAEAVARARSRPIPWATLKAAATPRQNLPVVTLADRAPVEHLRPRSEMVDIPNGFCLAVSFEEQPAGMCMHMSISVDRPNAGPHPAAVEAIVEECLRATPHDPAGEMHHWLEEFLIGDKPGGLAVNVVVVVSPRREGHA
jgi:hypothetical protein